MRLKSGYQPHVDGLRAVAVLIVLFYHLDWSWFPGGFIGVDVFFVISGFLITNMIVSQVESGSFSLRAFYMRRAKRLLPAYVVTILLTFIAATALLAPADFQAFARSAVASIFSVSNMFFWTDSGYFAADSLTKPLLHTWSLSVEEQFYLVFPMLAVLVLMRHSAKVLLWTLLGIGATSLVLNFIFQSGVALPPSWGPIADWAGDGVSTIYYLAPFRAFEFVIGASLVWCADARRAPKFIQDVATIGGALLIALSATLFTSETPFPSYNALIPCAGAAAVIWGGMGRAGAFLRLKPMLFIGQSSYSIYLVHWPIIALWGYYKFGSISPLQTVFIAAASMILGMALYLTVERPTRFGRLSSMLDSPRGALLGVLGATVLIVGPAASVAIGDGWSWRIPGQAIHFAGTTGANYEEIKGPLEGGYGCKDFCEFGDTSQQEIVLLVGDSHANHYVKALNERQDGIHYRLFQSAQCFVGATLQNTLRDRYLESCDAVRTSFQKWLDDDRVVGVIQAQHWSRYYYMKTADGSEVDLPQDNDIERFTLLVSDALANYGTFKGSVVLVGLAPASNFDCNLRPNLFPLECPDISRNLPQKVEAAARAAIASGTNIEFVNPETSLCPQGKCLLAEDGWPLYTDNLHLSVVGARLVVPEIVEALGRLRSQGR